MSFESSPAVDVSRESGVGTGDVERVPRGSKLPARQCLTLGIALHLAFLVEIHMRITAVALLFGALGLASCDDNGEPTIVPNVVRGTFALQTVNGAALPAVVVDSANPLLRIDALSGSITINDNNTFVDVTAIRQSLRGVTTTRTVTCAGTYRAVGLVFEFTEATPSPDCGRTFTGVVSGTTLNASVLGVPSAFAT